MSQSAKRHIDQMSHSTKCRFADMVFDQMSLIHIYLHISDQSVFIGSEPVCKIIHSLKLVDYLHIQTNYFLFIKLNKDEIMRGFA